MTRVLFHEAFYNEQASTLPPIVSPIPGEYHVIGRESPYSMNFLAFINRFIIFEHCGNITRRRDNSNVVDGHVRDAVRLFYGTNKERKSSDECRS